MVWGIDSPPLRANGDNEWTKWNPEGHLEIDSDARTGGRAAFPRESLVVGHADRRCGGVGRAHYATAVVCWGYPLKIFALGRLGVSTHAASQRRHRPRLGFLVVS